VPTFEIGVPRFAGFRLTDRQSERLLP